MKQTLMRIKNIINKSVNKISDLFYSLLNKYDLFIYFAVITFLSVALRVSLLDCIRGDYTAFLQPWYEKIYLEGASALGKSFGDYTPSYYYLLYILSLFRIDPESILVLHGIKWISIVFDFVLAIFTSLICYHLTKDKVKTLLSYTMVLLGLTVFLNSSLWGQCDSIYVSFCVMAIYFISRNKPNASMISYAFAFCFKIQSIFILPLFIVMFLRKQFKLKYILWIPLVYFVMALPSCFLAENFFVRLGEIFSIFYNQSVNSYNEVTLNAGSFYALIFTNFKEENFISAFAIYLAIAIIGTYIFFIYRSKAKFNDRTWLKIALIFAMIFPYFLPHMHERYFYIVDILVCVYALINPKKFYVAILAIMNSMIGYMVYLWNIPFINVVPQEQSDPTKALSFRFGAIIYLIAIIIVSIDLYKEIYPLGIEENKGE